MTRRVGGIWLDYEEAVAKIESCHRFGPKPGLERMRELMSRLGDPQKGKHFVHVAGTNGKGTTCTLVASMLKEAGFRTGLYLSPHVCDFRERMQLDGRMIPREELLSVAQEVLPLAEKMAARGREVSEFELITAMAFCWFAQKQCDVVVLEVGLGGRFDATNVIERPLVSAICSISLDHTQILGDTLAQIAREKCGIIKEGCPTVCYPNEPREALAVIRRTAAERRSRLVEASGIAARPLRSDLSGTVLRYGDRDLLLPFLGEHQVKNAKTALAVRETLCGLGWEIPLPAVARGFMSARLPARLEVLSQSPPVLLDGGHNPEGTAALADAVRRYLPGKKAIAVMGMLEDKDARSAVRNLAGTFSRVVAVKPSSVRGLSAGALARCWRDCSVRAQEAAGLSEALDLAFSAWDPEGEALVVCGSLYLAGDLRQGVLARLKSL